MFPWPNHILHILPPYLFDWIDVIDDDNCGFRAIVVTELGGEEAWPLLRRAMCMEIQMNIEQYLRVYLLAKTLDNAIFSIGSHSNEPARLFTGWKHRWQCTLQRRFLTLALRIMVLLMVIQTNCLTLPLRKACECA